MGIQDEAESSDDGSITYSISWYGADYTVDGLVQRLEKETFYVPSFQRMYVWTKKQASRFIESLLLGLPIPSVFVAKDGDSARHMIVDGQQRLKTLEFFYNDKFGEGRFRLVDVNPRWEGKNIHDLDSDDRTRLDDSIIPTIVFKQDAPNNDDTSIYHVFERLNTGGTKLTPQEVRNCVDAGPFVEFLHSENLDNKTWRSIAGPISKRCKDEELILRFLALHTHSKDYSRPMKDFLNKFSKKNRSISSAKINTYKNLFRDTINFINESGQEKIFRPETGLNAAIFDAVMVATARNRRRGTLTSGNSFKKGYVKLLNDQNFIDAYKKSTADETNVEKRLNRATLLLVD